jgi:hypothetical protein
MAKLETVAAIGRLDGAESPLGWRQASRLEPLEYFVLLDS